MLNKVLWLLRALYEKLLNKEYHVTTPQKYLHQGLNSAKINLFTRNGVHSQAYCNHRKSDSNVYLLWWPFIEMQYLKNGLKTCKQFLKKCSGHVL
jgi:hypothetical protein